MFFFLSKPFLFGIIYRFTKKTDRQYREFPYTLHPVAPDVSILHTHGTFVKTKRLTLAHYQVNSKLYLGFIYFLTDVLFLFQDPIQGTTLHLAICFLDSGSVGSQRELTFLFSPPLPSFCLKSASEFQQVPLSLVTDECTFLGPLTTISVLTAQSFRSMLSTLTVYLILLINGYQFFYLSPSLAVCTYQAVLSLGAECASLLTTCSRIA